MRSRPPFTANRWRRTVHPPSDATSRTSNEGGWQGFAVIAVCSLICVTAAARQSRTAGHRRDSVAADSSDGIDGSAVPPQVTFTRDIAPILFHSCAPCHRPGEAAPFSLAYLRATRRPTPIKSPPSPKDASCLRGCRNRTIRNLPTILRLSAEQIALFKAWVEQGAAEGERVRFATQAAICRRVAAWQARRRR